MKKSKQTKFPVARIKKIMQMDEDVGKVAQATPVVVSKSLELFMQALVAAAVEETRKSGGKKLTAYHLKRTILATPQFDFLADVVEGVTDPGTSGEGAEGEGDVKPKRKRKPKAVKTEEGLEDAADEDAIKEEDDD